jgi:iron complex outermembrane receptor protein
MLRFLFLFMVLIAAAYASGCPTENATVQGVVRDQSGGVIAGAHVVLSCNESSRETQTATDGSYTLQVPAGKLSLQVSHAGFETTTQTIETAPNQVKLADYILPLAHSVANVSVNASEGYIAQTSSAATKSAAPLLDTPQSISVITSEQLTQRNVQTLNEALRYSAGVSVDTYGVDPRYDSFLIRGFGSSTNGFFLDGLRFPGYLGQTDPYMAEDVTVLKGPSSVLYGQGAPGGLVNITTKQPSSTSSREVQIDLGNLDRKQVKGDFTGLLDRDGHWRYRLTALYRDSGTQVNFSPDDRWFAAPALTWAPTDRTSITFLSFYERDHSGWAQFLPAEGTLLASPDGPIPRDFFTGIPGFDGVHRTQWSVGYLFDHRFNSIWTFHQSFRAYNVFYNGATAYGVGLASDQRTLNRYADTFRDTDTLYGVDSQAQAKLRTGFVKHNILAGYDLSRTGDYPTGTFAAVTGIDVVQPNYNTPVPTLSPSYDERQWQRQSGVYLQDQMSVAERFTLLLSGREDFVASLDRDLIAATVTPSSTNHFSGRAGLSYAAGWGFAPYVSYSTSFEPTLGVNFYGQPYVPTTGSQFETGLKWQPTGWNSFVTASFYNISQQHVETTDPDQPLNTIQVGAVRSRGAEVEGVAKLHHGIVLHGAYAYDDAKVTDTTEVDQLGKYLVSVPRQTASAFAEYAFPRGPLAGLGLGFGTRYVGKEAGSADNSLQVPGYTLFDGWLHYDWKRASFAVNATNLGDKRYVAVCNSLSYCNYGFSRRVIGSVTFRW